MLSSPQHLQQVGDLTQSITSYDTQEKRPCALPGSIIELTL